MDVMQKFYYTYNADGYITEKSTTTLQGIEGRDCWCYVDFDLKICNVAVGYVSSEKTLQLYTILIKSTDKLINEIKGLQTTLDENSIIYEKQFEDFKLSNAESELEIDERISKLELGLA